MKGIVFLGIWLMALPLLGAEDISFRNDREGKSFYSDKSHEKMIKRVLKRIDLPEINEAFKRVQKGLESKSLCAYDLNQSLKNELKQYTDRPYPYEGVIYQLRKSELIDDVVAKILLDAQKTVSTKVAPKNEADIYFPDGEEAEKIQVLIMAFEDRFLKNSCFDDAYKALYSEIKKLDKSLDSKKMEAHLYKAQRDNRITGEIYYSLEQARINELENASLTLKSFYQKIKSLRTQYPLTNPLERSDYSTAKASKLNMSRRQKLYQSYTDLQIIMMANVVSFVRARLDDTKVSIVSSNGEVITHTEDVTPTDRFHYAILHLRRKITMLSTNTYFSGRTPDFIDDVLTAAYEVGITPAVEMDTVAGLKDVWNPRKNFWEKSQMWIRSFSSVAAIAIPTPFGFVPTLAVIIIEATSGNKNKSSTQIDPTRWFQQ